MANGDLRRHVDALFAQSTEDGFLFLVCSRRNFAGTWHGDVSKGVAAATRMSRDQDVWLGVGLRRESPGKGKRGLANEIDGIVGLWADVDFADPVHSKMEHLPPTLDDALDLTTTFIPHKPTIMVHSGHGVQAWWLFQEPWTFDNDRERSTGAKLSRRFSATLKQCAVAREWTVDSVYDLARVMRPAGTLNHKTDPAIPTTFIDFDDSCRYDPDDLEAVCIAEEFVPTATGGARVTFPVGHLLLDARRAPPTQKLLALTTNDERVRATLEGQRPDLNDQSASGYDMSLAIASVRVGWTDQEIADLLITHRRERHLDLKTHKGVIRLDYYQRTIGNARQIVKREQSIKEIETGTSTPRAHVELNDDDKAAIIARVSAIIDAPVERWIRYGEGADAVFVLVLSGGITVRIGTARDVDRQATFRAALYPVTNRSFPSVKNWTAVLNDLGAIVDIEDNPESGEDVRFTAIVQDYLATKARFLDDEDWTRAFAAGEPFVLNGQLHMNANALMAWVRLQIGDPLRRQDVWTGFRHLGMKNDKIDARVGKRTFTKRYWMGPIDDIGERLGLDLSTPSDARESTERRRRVRGSSGSGGGAETRETTTTDAERREDDDDVGDIPI